MVAGRGRKIRPANTVTANATGAPTRATTARNSELKIILTIFQNNRMPLQHRAPGPYRCGHPARRGDLFPLLDLDQDVVAVGPHGEGAQPGPAPEERHVL